MLALQLPGRAAAGFWERAARCPQGRSEDVPASGVSLGHNGQSRARDDHRARRLGYRVEIRARDFVVSSTAPDQRCQLRRARCNSRRTNAPSVLAREDQAARSRLAASPSSGRCVQAMQQSVARTSLPWAWACQDRRRTEGLAGEKPCRTAISKLSAANRAPADRPGLGRSAASGAVSNGAFGHLRHGPLAGVGEDSEGESESCSGGGSSCGTEVALSDDAGSPVSPPIYRERTPTERPGTTTLAPCWMRTSGEHVRLSDG